MSPLGERQHELGSHVAPRGCYPFAHATPGKAALADMHDGRKHVDGSGFLSDRKQIKGMLYHIKNCVKRGRRMSV